jgi:hypothetical protein
MNSVDEILSSLEPDGQGGMDLIKIEEELLKLLRESSLSFVKSTQSLVNIAIEIKTCDSFLEEMGQTLTGFQDDLFR